MKIPKIKHLRGGLEPGTVRLRASGEARIGQDLLGNLAGEKCLSFVLYYNPVAETLTFEPHRDACAGFAARYSRTHAKSPYVSLNRFLRRIGQSVHTLPVGVFKAQVCEGNIVIPLRFRRRSRPRAA